jgi:hypothetical protein
MLESNVLLTQRCVDGGYHDAIVGNNAMLRELGLRL